jgi:hypothetical protein
VSNFRSRAQLKFIGKIVRRHAADRRATKAARPAPENLDFVLPVGTALGWQTPLNPPPMQYAPPEDGHANHG